MNFDQEAILESRKPATAVATSQAQPSAPHAAAKPEAKKSVLDDALKATVLTSPTTAPAATKATSPRRD
jgi:hypothetical protein